MNATTGGIILCGGESSRMGRPKAWLPFGNEALLQHVAKIVASAVSPVIVVAAPAQDLPELPAEIVVTHDPVAHQGPLVGLTVGLKEAAKMGLSQVFVCGCDMPFLSAQIINFLVHNLGEGLSLIPEHEGKLEPLTAVYKTVLAEQFESLISKGERSIQRTIRQLGLPIIASDELRFMDKELRIFTSLNDPNSYQKHAL